MNQIRKVSINSIIFLLITSISSILTAQTSNPSHKRIFQDGSIENDLATMTEEFSIPELTIQSSPSSANSITFPTSEKIIDYDVSPAGTTVAIVTAGSEGKSMIKFWQLGEAGIIDSCFLPSGFYAKAITWHPTANSLFIMGSTTTTHQIYRIFMRNEQINYKLIFTSSNRLRRLVVCPRPFVVNYNYEKGESYYAYRLFLGMDNGDKSYRIVSITDTGDRLYQVIGPSETRTKEADYNSGAVPSEMNAKWALPLAFHPGGHEMIWEDNDNRFFVARYNSKYWGDSKPLNIALDNDGTITPTPNGLAFIHWQKEKQGIGIYLLSSKKEERQLENFQFVSTPSSVPDGKGIVGLTFSNSCYSFIYHPINIPIPDVMNAWMFAGSIDEITLFQKKNGLFRPNQFDQLYKLYETENYYCDGYDRTAPTRPYLVTTDIFWELFGAAYQGLFIIKERDEAMSNFRMFISNADTYFKNQNVKSSWQQVFDVLSRFYSGDKSNKEVLNIINEKNCKSEITGTEYSFADLKPRGHYSSSSEMSDYFKAFRYLTTILNNENEKVEELNRLPQEVVYYATKWINAYSGFIAPSRSTLVWRDLQQKTPAYCQYPLKEETIFPLSWGFDNEVLYATVYHPSLPAELQVKGSDGERLIPSGIDIAAALGNNLADNLLLADYSKYPPLRKVINNLKENFRLNNKNGTEENLYDKWINAIAVQWANPTSMKENINDDIWQAKRLQTGLATWATLRHATVLVNERSAAECGEGGFEEILMRAPRGYVEPDPKTFAAIASLFEKAITYVSSTIANKEDINASDDQEKKSLYDGIIFRLKGAADEARKFQLIAEKEIRDEPLTNEENRKILYVARTAEHLFLIFNSLANKDYALSDPDPMSKIVDVAGDGILSPFVMAAVGNSMEWDYIVPYYGRREIVKGSIYSYYEFQSNQLFNDNQWRDIVSDQDFLPWIKPFISYQNALNMPKTSY